MVYPLVIVCLKPIKKADPLNLELAYSPTDPAGQNPSGYLPYASLNTTPYPQVKNFYYDSSPAIGS
jgi:hypothetical protein